MKGILFKPWKIKAIADGGHDRDWQTRRVIKPQPKYFHYSVDGQFPCTVQGEQFKPRYQAGEVVYIKEAFRYIHGGGEVHDFGVWYKLDGEYKWWRDNGGLMNYPINEKNRSPRFMPAWAARYFIKITAVRAERTRDITFEDCLAEGIVSSEFWVKSPVADSIFNVWYNAVGCKVPIDDYIDAGWIAYARSVYFALYDSINGKGSHENNWDFKYSFVKVDKPVGKGE